MQYLLQNSVGDTAPVLHPYRGVTLVNAATSQQIVEVRHYAFILDNIDAIAWAT